MELINWSLSALDKMFSQRKESPGEPLCPLGTFAFGYVRDAWDSWCPLCLEPLSIEDAEDLFIFWTLITGLLMIGFGGALLYRKIGKIGKSVAGSLACPPAVELQTPTGAMVTRLTELHQRIARIEGLICNISARSDARITGLTNKISARTEEDKRQRDNICRQTKHLVNMVTALSDRLEEMSRVTHGPTRGEEALSSDPLEY